MFHSRRVYPIYSIGSYYPKISTGPATPLTIDCANTAKHLVPAAARPRSILEAWNIGSSAHPRPPRAQPLTPFAKRTQFHA